MTMLDADSAAPVLHDSDGGAWVDGFGITAPEVARYAEVLQAPPDAVTLAMRNVAESLDLRVLDQDSATLLALLARSHRPHHVLEVGTGIGHATVHMARAVPDDCTITSIEADPERQTHAHAFLERAEVRCALELRLGDPLRVLRDGAARAQWDIVLLGDPTAPRLELLDFVAPQMSPDALLVVPWALRGGRVASNEAAWGEDEDAERQRTLNRCVATDPRFADVTLLPVGDGVLLARRA